ncbi:hypothetical protein [Nocardia transvalensis]|uniref:hypothetical protein n=1 Tax=Nocardia transvalensis TaxID=37333 RepID=UPI0018938ECA|nr:hypothetical protein [Nocardia transvalensis]MBF6327649.1 hypothetical protein [Nocardia transvalensis]
MSEGLLGSATGIAGPAEVTVTPRTRLVTPYPVRITGTYRCPPGTPGRLLVACVQARVGAGDRGDVVWGTVVGGEVLQIDAGRQIHSFRIDLGRQTDVDALSDPWEYPRGEMVRVVAKLYYDEFTDRLEWERFVEDRVDEFPAETTIGASHPTEVGYSEAHRELVLASVAETVVID